MVDEAKQEQEFEPTPYQNAYRKDLDKQDETETVETKDTEKATPKKSTGCAPFFINNKLQII